jgi:aryl-alcohol dehydrogenase-like predicted oxidoreductase
MEYRSLGRTGVKVSPLCLGCMNFGDKTPLNEATRMVEMALDRGINFLDTADIYGRGASESMVGDILATFRKRDRIVLASKVHGAMDDHDPNAKGNSRRHIIEGCEASLRRLKTDYLDLYQIHRPDPATPIDETLRALDDLIRAGKVRYIGTSTFAAWQITESLWTSHELGLNRFICEQPPYHLLDRRIERELLPMARTYGIGIIPWSPLASGFLTGKYQRNTQAPADGRIGHQPHRKAMLQNEAAFDVLDFVTGLADEKKVSVSQFALAWCMSKPGITSPIIGPRTIDQIEDNLKALDVTLSEEDHARIDDMIPPGRATVPYYEAHFGPHPERIF